MTHTSTEQPEALRLAECLDYPLHVTMVQFEDAAAELRRLHARVQELEAQLEESTHTTKRRMGGNWLTVVYRDIQPGDEAHAIAGHPKASALSWSNALHDRDAALAAQAKQKD